jgi:precorrin-2 methylase
MFATLAIHMARNCRFGVAGSGAGQVDDALARLPGTMPSGVVEAAREGMDAKVLIKAAAAATQAIRDRRGRGTSTVDHLRASNAAKKCAAGTSVRL